MDSQAQTDTNVKGWRTEATISVEQAGRVLGLGRSAAYECARTGAIPTLRLGHKLRVPVAALRRMLGELQNDNEAAGGDPVGKVGVDVAQAGI